jgi:transposase
MKKNISKTTKAQKRRTARSKAVCKMKQKGRVKRAKNKVANRERVKNGVEQKATEEKNSQVVTLEGKAHAKTRAFESCTIGIDLGDKRSRYCMLNADGQIVRESSVATQREALEKVFGQMGPCRIAIEVGTHSPWVSRKLQELGQEVIVANARQVRLIYNSKRKNDKLDAEKLARLARTDPKLLHGIRHRGAEAQGDLLLIRSRAELVETRTALVNMARGLVKSRGDRLPQCTTDGFGEELLEDMDEAVVRALKPVMKLVEQMTETIQEYDQQIEELAKKYPEVARLQQVSGVGPVIATTYVLTLEDPNRFRRSRDVGGHLGLTPGQSDSGESQPQKRITKAGDGYLRSMLVQGAHYILGPHGPDTDLRRWGLKLAGSGGDRGKKRAVVAVARKLAILLLVLWKTGAHYEPLQNSQKQEKPAA